MFVCKQKEEMVLNKQPPLTKWCTSVGQEFTRKF